MRNVRVPRTYQGEIRVINGEPLKEIYKLYRYQGGAFLIETPGKPPITFESMAAMSKYLKTRIDTDHNPRSAADTAFKKAIEAGRLSDNPEAWNYAGDFMYMGANDDGLDLFKHRMTRNYIGAIPLKWQVFPDERPAPHSFDGCNSVPGSRCHEEAACSDCGREVDNGGGCSCACHTYV